MSLNVDTLLHFLDGYVEIAERSYTLESTQLLMENNGMAFDIATDTLQWNGRKIVIPKNTIEGQKGYCVGFLIMGINYVINGGEEPDWEELLRDERLLIHKSYIAVEEIKQHLIFQQIRWINKRRF